jgi:hypothetical protein
MKRSVAYPVAFAAALLTACGGGGNQTNTVPAEEVYDAPGKPTVAETRVATPDGAALGRIDVRLHSARGEVDVWVALDQSSSPPRKRLRLRPPGCRARGVRPVR